MEKRPSAGTIFLVLVPTIAFAALVAFGGTGYAGGTAAERQYGQNKVAVCHHAPPPRSGQPARRHKTLMLPPGAVAAHLRHGDTPGPCPTTNNVTRHSSAAHVKKFHPGKTLRAELKAQRGKGKGKGKGRR